MLFGYKLGEFKRGDLSKKDKGNLTRFAFMLVSCRGRRSLKRIIFVSQVRAQPCQQAPEFVNQSQC